MPHNGARPPKKESIMQTTSNIIDKLKALIKPNKLDITSNEDKTVASYCRTIRKRFWSNYCNSRRILLSSIQGAAVKQFKLMVFCMNFLD